LFGSLENSGLEVAKNQFRNSPNDCHAKLVDDELGCKPLLNGIKPGKYSALEHHRKGESPWGVSAL
jgi:hypothetical protein